MNSSRGKENKKNNKIQNLKKYEPTINIPITEIEPGFLPPNLIKVQITR